MSLASVGGTEGPEIMTLSSSGVGGGGIGFEFVGGKGGSTLGCGSGGNTCEINKFKSGSKDQKINEPIVVIFVPIFAATPVER